MKAKKREVQADKQSSIEICFNGLTGGGGRAAVHFDRGTHHRSVCSCPWSGRFLQFTAAQLGLLKLQPYTSMMSEARQTVKRFHASLFSVLSRVTNRLVTLVTIWHSIAADSAVDFVCHFRSA